MCLERSTSPKRVSMTIEGPQLVVKAIVDCRDRHGHAKRVVGYKQRNFEVDVIPAVLEQVRRDPMQPIKALLERPVLPVRLADGVGYRISDSVCLAPWSG